MINNAMELTSDPALAFVAPALDPDWMTPRLEQILGQSLTIQTVRVIRHKVGRRCLIAYDLTLKHKQTHLTLLGKARSRSLDHHSYHLQQYLWHHGFDDSSSDKISVPEPVGMIPELHLWLQRSVPGKIATTVLPHHPSLSEQIATAIVKFHQADFPPRKCHTPTDELRILQQRIPQVAEMFPQWEKRLQKVLEASATLATSLPQTPTTGIHRDFYPDQVLVSNNRLYLLDLDLCCQGDPALDIGNFIAHLSEESLRTHRHPEAFSQQENLLVKSFCQLSDDFNLRAIESYKTLTLVRHLYISTQIPSRRATTAPLLTLCEERLAQSL